MKLIPILLVMAGVLLIYSAHKKDDPRNILFETLGIKRRVDNTGFGGNDLGTGTIQKVPNPAAKPSNYATATPGTHVVSV